MKNYYVKEDDKPNLLKKLFNIIIKRDNEIIIQPVGNKERRILKATKRINSICSKQGVNNIVLCKSLRENKEFMQTIEKSDIHIFDGRWIFYYMAYETAQYIIQQTNQKKENTEISILTSNISNIAIETIKMLVKEFKRVNVVTNNINKFKYLENKIFNQYGILITVTNNKRKSLAKSRIILNFDFAQELINQYNIFDEAFVVNFQGNVKIKRKRFNGVCINDFDIYSSRADDYFEMEKLHSFFLKDILEAELYRQDSFYNIRSNITRNFYKIKRLYRKQWKTVVKLQFSNIVNIQVLTILDK